MDQNEQIRISIVNVDNFFSDCTHLMATIRDEFSKNKIAFNRSDNAVYRGNSSSIHHPQMWNPSDLYLVLQVERTSDYYTLNIPLRNQEKSYEIFNPIELLIGKYRNAEHLQELYWYNRGFLHDDWAKESKSEIDDIYITLSVPQEENMEGNKPRFSKAAIYHEDIFAWTGNVAEKLKAVIEKLDELCN